MGRVKRAGRENRIFQFSWSRVIAMDAQCSTMCAILLKNAGLVAFEAHDPPATIFLGTSFSRYYGITRTRTGGGHGALASADAGKHPLDLRSDARPDAAPRRARRAGGRGATGATGHARWRGARSARTCYRL